MLLVASSNAGGESWPPSAPMLHVGEIETEREARVPHGGKGKEALRVGEGTMDREGEGGAMSRTEREGEAPHGAEGCG